MFQSDRRDVHKIAGKTRKGWACRGISLVEVTLTLALLMVAAIGMSGYRYYSTMWARRADVQITAARLASQLLYNWKGAGGYSGYCVYELDEMCDYGLDLEDEDDYDPTDIDEVKLSSVLQIYYNAPGPDVPEGFTALDYIAKPNYRVLLNGANYYATLSYKDQLDEPRLLNVCVAWMQNYNEWVESGRHYSVNLSTYAED